ncbi:hypothetical protein GCM10027049_07350 [Mucilaginibacter puniceus]
MKYLLSEIKYKVNEFFTAIDSKDKKTYETLKTYGYVAIPGFIDSDKCQELIEGLESKVSLDKAWKDEEGSDSRIFGIDRVDGSFKDLFETASLKSIYKKYIDRYCRFHFVMANKVCFKNDNVGSGGGWHRDVINRRQLKFIMYLNDVDENNGCFQYIKYSHTIPEKWKINRIIGRGQNDVRYTEKEIDSLLEKGYQLVDLTGKAGTLIIVDTSGIHRGSPLKEGLRYAATNYMSDTKFGESMTELLV